MKTRIECVVKNVCKGIKFAPEKYTQAPDGEWVCIADYDEYIQQIKDRPEYKEQEEKENRKKEMEQEEKQLAVRRMHLKSRYGLTPEEFDKMLEKQNHSCGECGRVVLRFLPRFEGNKCVRLICRRCGDKPIVAVKRRK